MASFQPLTSTTPAPTTGTAGFLATNWLAPTTGTTQVGPPKPTIVASAAPATTQLNNITTQAKTIDSGMAAQSQRIAQEKAAADAAAAQAKAVSDAAAAKKTQDDASAKAIADATAALEKYNLPTGAKLADNGTVIDANGNPIGDASKYLKPTDGSLAGDAAKLAADRDAAFEQMKRDTEAYRNGSIPLTPDQQAQVDNLQRQFDEAKKQQQLYNQNYEGGMNIAGIVSGRARYAPEIAMGQLKAAQNEGVAKITELDQKAASAIATLKQAFRDSNYKGIKDAYDLYNDYQKQKSAELQKQVEAAASLAKSTREEIYTTFTKPINDIAADAAKAGAAPSVISAILAAKSVGAAIAAAGDSLQTASGIVGEYKFYEKQARAAGQTPVDFNTYQNIDANRKKSIAAAGVTPSGMTTSQTTMFNALADKMNKSPLVAADDRAVILKGVTEQLRADPKNAALQVAFIYSMIQALDTYQSAVREGEIGLLSGTQGLGDKLTNLPDKISKGTPLSINKINEYLGVASLLTDSISAAADKKRRGFAAQADTSGIGTQFRSYQDALREVGDTTGNLIKAEADAEAKVLQYVSSHPEEATKTAEWADGKNADDTARTSLDVYNYLKARGQIQ